jgi:hypothetical protein
MEAYPAGAVIIFPDNTPHFHLAKSGECIAQVTAIGPLELDYLSAKDDPRNSKSQFKATSIRRKGKPDGTGDSVSNGAD